jgi:hypothetical protein
MPEACLYLSVDRCWQAEGSEFPRSVLQGAFMGEKFFSRLTLHLPKLKIYSLTIQERNIFVFSFLLF